MFFLVQISENQYFSLEMKPLQASGEYANKNEFSFDKMISSYMQFFGNNFCKKDILQVLIRFLREVIVLTKSLNNNKSN